MGAYLLNDGSSVSLFRAASPRLLHFVTSVHFIKYIYSTFVFVLPKPMPTPQRNNRFRFSSYAEYVRIFPWQLNLFLRIHGRKTLADLRFFFLVTIVSFYGSSEGTKRSVGKRRSAMTIPLTVTECAPLPHEQTFCKSWVNHHHSTSCEHDARRHRGRFCVRESYAFGSGRHVQELQILTYPWTDAEPIPDISSNLLRF